MTITVDQVTQTLRTTTGTQDFTISGMGASGDFVAAVSILTGYDTTATETEGSEPDAYFGQGATDGTNSVCYGTASNDQKGLMQCRRLVEATEFVCLVNGTGTEILHVAFDSWITDGIRINVTTATTVPLKLTITLFADDAATKELKAVPGVFSSAAVPGDITTTGVDPTVVLGFGAMTSGSAQKIHAAINYGFAVDNGVSIDQHCLRIGAKNATGTGEPIGLHSSSWTWANIWNALLSAVTIDSMGAGKFTVSWHTGSVIDQALYLALEFPARVGTSIVEQNNPTVTGSHSVTGAGFTPQFAFGCWHNFTAKDTHRSDGEPGTVTVNVVGANGIRAAGWTHEDAVSVSQSVSYWSESELSCMDHAQADNALANLLRADTVSFTSDGVDFNVAAESFTSSNREWFWLFIEEDTATTVGHDYLMEAPLRQLHTRLTRM